MKKNLFKNRLLPMLLVLVLLLGLFTGCASEESVEVNEPAQEAEKPADNNKDAVDSEVAESNTLFDETVSLSYFGAMWSPYSADQTDITDEIERLTNTDVDWQWTPTDSFEDKLSAVLASGELPDIISWGWKTNVVDMLIDQGAIIPLDDYLETYMPDYAALLDESSGPAVKNASDGKTYSVKSVFDYPPLQSFMVRADWVENVGMDIPTDWEGWVELWKAFRDQDANGDGDPNNEIPVSSDSNLAPFAYMFGIELSSDAKYAVYPDGSYGLASEHPNYDLFIDNMRMLYEEGLLDREYQVRSGDDANLFGIMDNNTLGTTCTSAERAKLSTQVNAEVDEDAYWQCIVPIAGPNGDQLLFSRPKYSNGCGISVKALEEGKAEQVAQWLNWFFTEEGTKLMNYGIEGVHHEVVDGVPVLKDPYINGFLEARQAGLIDQTLPLNWQGENYQMILLQGQAYESLDPAAQTFVDGLTINDDYYFPNVPVFSTETIVEKGVDLFEKFFMIRDSYITGQMTREQYDTEYAALKSAGLDQIQIEVSDVYTLLK